MLDAWPQKFVLPRLESCQQRRTELLGRPYHLSALALRFWKAWSSWVVLWWRLPWWSSPLMWFRCNHCNALCEQAFILNRKVILQVASVVSFWGSWPASSGWWWDSHHSTHRLPDGSQWWLLAPCLRLGSVIRQSCALKLAGCWSLPRHPLSSATGNYFVLGAWLVECLLFVLVSWCTLFWTQFASFSAQNSYCGAACCVNSIFNTADGRASASNDSDQHLQRSTHLSFFPCSWHILWLVCRQRPRPQSARSEIPWSVLQASDLRPVQSGCQWAQNC